MAWNTRIDAGWVTIDISPSPEVIHSDIRNIGQEFKTFRTPLRESVRDVMVPSIDTNFAVGGRPPWQPLGEQTVERRTRQGTGTQILVESGSLRRSATQFSRWNIGTDSAEISNWPQRDLVKAAVHEGGATVRTKLGISNIPARPFLLIQDEDAARIDEIFLDWMESRARRWWNR